MKKGLAAARRAKTAESEERLLAEAEKKNAGGAGQRSVCAGGAKEAADRMDREPQAPRKSRGKKRAEAEELRGRVSVLREKSKSYGELQEALEKLREAVRCAARNSKRPTGRRPGEQSELKKARGAEKEPAGARRLRLMKRKKLEKEAAKGARKAGLQKTLEQIRQKRRQQGENSGRERKSWRSWRERKSCLRSNTTRLSVPYERKTGTADCVRSTTERCVRVRWDLSHGGNKQSRKTAPSIAEPKQERLEEVRREIAGLRAGLSAAGEG